MATPTQIGRTFDGRPPGWERALEALRKEGVAIPVRVPELKGTWYVHADLLERRFRPRTTLLSPFDDLVSDRNHTEQLFGFRFRLEIYVPKAKREFGYFVLPILHGDRLIGRMDAVVRSRGGGLARERRVRGGGRAEGGGARRRGARSRSSRPGEGPQDIRFTRVVPSAWRSELT